MKPILELLLALCLVHVTLTWTEDKPVEEDSCDAEWDGKVEYKAEGETDQAQPDEQEEPPVEGEEDEEEGDAVTEKKEEGEEPEEGPASEEGEEPEEGPASEEGEEPEQGPANEEEQPGKEAKQPGEKTPTVSKQDERPDPSNTYHKSAELVRAAANVDDIQDEYLKGSLDNRLQEHIRNPIIGAAGKLPNFKKIEHCFKTMKQNLKKEIDASKKVFADCKKKTDSSYECMVKMEPDFATHVKAIGDKIVQCMNKSK